MSAGARECSALRGISILPLPTRLPLIVLGLCATLFALLTIGLAVGAFGMTHLHNAHDYRGDPKILWSGLVWLIYLGLILMRWKFAQSGRRFALGAVGSFAFVLLTFWGTNMLSPLHHP